MKKILMSLAFAVTTLAAMAIPAKRGLWSTITLADGTQVKVELRGDEHMKWLQAADGTCYIDSAGTYVQMTPAQINERRQQRMAKRKAPRRAIYASTTDGLGQKGTMSRGAVPSIGEYTIPVVMVQFSNKQFQATTTVEKMKRYYNEVGYTDNNGSKGSVRDYFIAQSGGQFVPNFDVVGIVTLPNPYSTYGADIQDVDDNVWKISGDVVEAAVEQLGTDFSQYVVPAGDAYHKAGVPLLVMFFAGKGQATEDETYANKSLIWPCEWDGDEDPYGGKYQGVQFNSFFVGNELMGNKMMGLGLFCHEFGHALGLPDFYCTDYSYQGDDAFSNWSIMDTGAYVGNTYAPIGYNAYEKSYMGWLELNEIGDEEELVLESPIGLAENSAVIMRNGNKETFIFENRQPGTWYPTTFGKGVLVSCIAYDKTAWSYNTVNNVQNKKRACVLTANNETLYYSGSSANLYGGSGKTSINKLKTLSGSTIDPGITDIQKNNDGTITLTFEGNGNIDDPDDPKPSEDGVLFYESFDQCANKGGNDGMWNGAIASGTFVPDNDGWVYTSAHGAFQCARFGTSSVAGSAQTPAFTLNGTATLTFKAGAWNNAKNDTILYLTAEGGTVEPTEVTVKRGAFTDCTATVTGTGKVKILFEMTNKSGGRFFLDEVKVTESGQTSAIQSVAAKKHADTRVFTIDGRYVGNDLRQLEHGLYIVGGKKVVK
ncbi:MAG: M6 family metalloprotease domain-containing protein [Prevotella sp.]|nr:M6 family metalloprotease domain-containing protein [Prevotella sp.]